MHVLKKLEIRISLIKCPSLDFGFPKCWKVGLDDALEAWAWQSCEILKSIKMMFHLTKRQCHL